ncbi:MAG: hypothetical protein GX139_06085 [Armatimonadetes bacterium]|nr:hypothetical protein [Armatimonadota bacterium]
MFIPEAKNYLGKDCAVTFSDRHGKVHTQTLHIHDVSFVPMYGACLVGDIDDIWLDRVTKITAVV